MAVKGWSVPILIIAHVFDAGAMCCDKLKRFDEVIEWCDEGLSVRPHMYYMCLLLVRLPLICFSLYVPPIGHCVSVWCM